MKTKKQKREEAAERQATYVPKPEHFGIRQKVKAGLITVREAREIVGRPTQHNVKIGTWLSRRK